MILAGDIGGTKTNLALYEAGEIGYTLVAQSQFASRDYPTFDGVIEAFRTSAPDVAIDAACFGVAGAVIEGRCRTTNLPWALDEVDLARTLGSAKVRLLNDLEATAYGMLYLQADEWVDLNPDATKRQGNRAVLAAGTGLGEAMLFFDGNGFHPSGSEGGHCDFAPLDAQQDALLAWLRERYPLHVSYERIVSGPGITTLYTFLLETGFAPEPPMLRTLPPEADQSAAISRCALEMDDPLCCEALRLFVSIYAAEAGNWALKAMALGGVYIGGGIAPKILPLLHKHFMASFVTKGRFESLLRTLPVKVSLNPETALLGAMHFAVDKVIGKQI
ncbi:MAG: glucokinase [Campylobacterales bacterium]|nr:glucokinase [Campylobacterales bacterium]